MLQDLQNKLIWLSKLNQAKFNLFYLSNSKLRDVVIMSLIQLKTNFLYYCNNLKDGQNFSQTANVDTW